jgi:hypothetical protein
VKEDVHPIFRKPDTNLQRVSQFPSLSATTQPHVSHQLTFMFKKLSTQSYHKLNRKLLQGLISSKLNAKINLAT